MDTGSVAVYDHFQLIKEFGSAFRMFLELGEREVSSEAIGFSLPVDVLSVSLSDPIFSLDKLPKLRTGWRTFLFDNDTAVLFADFVGSNNETAVARLLSLNEGPHVQGYIRAMELAQDIARDRGEKVAVAIFEIPEIFLRTLVLRASEDLFFPVEPFFHSLRVEQPNYWVDIVDIARTNRKEI